jgi:hypothetical protein
LAFEHLEQPPFGFIVIGLDKAKALAGAFLWNRFAHEHFKVRFLVRPMSHVPAINPDGEGRRWARQRGPLPRASIDEGDLLTA